MHQKKNTILIIEDEPPIRKVLNISLESAGYKVVESSSGREGTRLAASVNPELILLDLGLPDIDGKNVIMSIREWSQIPIIVCSVRSSDDEVIEALAAGADDYITKPFSPRELVARVKTVLRRTQGRHDETPVLRVGEVTLDPSRRRTFVGEREVVLTTTEFDLLAFLMRRPGRVYERGHLLSAVWGYTAAAGTRTVDVHVAQLRAKLGVASPIRTVRGVGYAAESP